MGTFQEVTTHRPRSLADDLRMRSQEQLESLLSQRPDLLHPVPTDLGQLATRATTSPSVTAVLNNLNTLALQICHAFAGLSDPCSRDEVHRGLSKASGYQEQAVNTAIDHLWALGLVWGNDEELHLIRSARESFGGHPCGLGPSFSQSRRQVRQYEEEPELVRKLMASAPTQVIEIVEQLLWTNPIGSVRNADRRIHIDEIKTPTDWLLARELLVPVGDSSVVMPREVALALRDDQLLQSLNTQEPSVEVGQLQFQDQDALGAHEALNFVRLCETLLEHWSIEPPSQLRGGGLAIRDLSLAAELLRVDEVTTALVIEVSFAAGLLASSADEEWVPTTGYDRWLGIDDAARWCALATAWCATTRASHLIGSQGGERINALSAQVERNYIAPLRSRILHTLANMNSSTITNADALVAYIDWHHPRQATRSRAEAIFAILQQASALGITARCALTSFGRAIATEQDDPATLLGNFLPEPVDHIIVQSDLTALAPGRLLALPHRTMGVIADVESLGMATTYRFTEASIRRALDQGKSAHDILEFLKTLSKTPLPQPLVYLVEDVSRKHGALRLGVASVYLRCDDANLISQVQVDRRLASLRFKQIAPGILVSASPADVVLGRLRDAGYAPVAESADGTVMIHRPDERRTSAKSSPPAVTSVIAPSPRLVKAAVRAMKSGEQVQEQKHQSVGTPRMSSSETLQMLNDALNQNLAVWIGYADKSGVTSERIVEPLSITGGFLTGMDLRSSEVRTFTISRITGAEFVQSEQEGNAS